MIEIKLFNKNKKNLWPFRVLISKLTVAMSDIEFWTVIGEIRKLIKSLKNSVFQIENK